MTEAHCLTLTAYPAGWGPYDRWEITTPTGEVLMSGTVFPIEVDKVRAACEAYHRRLNQPAEEPKP